MQFKVPDGPNVFCYCFVIKLLLLFRIGSLEFGPMDGYAGFVDSLIKGEKFVRKCKMDDWEFTVNL